MMGAARPMTEAGVRRRLDTRGGSVTILSNALAALAIASSAVGLIASGGPGRQTVTTARGAPATLYGEGLYAADTWLIGVGNRGQYAPSPPH